MGLNSYCMGGCLYFKKNGIEESHGALCDPLQHNCIVYVACKALHCCGYEVIVGQRICWLS